jgi:hypothetical protein
MRRLDVQLKLLRAVTVTESPNHAPPHRNQISAHSLRVSRFALTYSFRPRQGIETMSRTSAIWYSDVGRSEEMGTHKPNAFHKQHTYILSLVLDN